MAPEVSPKCPHCDASLEYETNGMGKLIVFCPTGRREQDRPRPVVRQVVQVEWEPTTPRAIKLVARARAIEADRLARANVRAELRFLRAERRREPTMLTITCAACESVFEHVKARGRPRTRCDTCMKAKRYPPIGLQDESPEKIDLRPMFVEEMARDYGPPRAVTAKEAREIQAGWAVPGAETLEMLGYVIVDDQSAPNTPVLMDLHTRSTA